MHKEQYSYRGYLPAFSGVLFYFMVTIKVTVFRIFNNANLWL